MNQIIKCGDCWAHYEIGQLHICDDCMKILVAHKRYKDLEALDEDVELGED